MPAERIGRTARRSRSLLAALCMTLISADAIAERLYVAVASNFAGAMTEIASRFERDTGHAVILSPGATGKHHAQIVNGAPFDVFFAADARRPALLEQAGLAVAGSRFTYAVGRLVLWSPRAGFVDGEGRVLQTGDFRFLAIANPELAPYGRAAQEVLEALGVWSSLRGRLVRGENIAQAYQFVRSGNASLGFIARAQLGRGGESPEGSAWDVPRNLYQPIEQQAVLLNDTPGGRAFLEFARTGESLLLIEDYGYLRP